SCGPGEPRERFTSGWPGNSPTWRLTVSRSRSRRYVSRYARARAEGSSPGQAWTPPDARQVQYSRPGDPYTFGGKQRAFHEFVASVAAQPPSGGNHAMAGHVGSRAPAHDVSHRPGGPRPSGELGDIAVGRHSTDRNAADNR